MQKPERVPLLHVVASPLALDAAAWPNSAVVLRIAPDEALALAANPPDLSADPHAIVRTDTGYAGLWLSEEDADAFLARACPWQLPKHRPAFAQGAVAGLPMKLWLARGRVLLLVPAPFAADLEERLS